MLFYLFFFFKQKTAYEMRIRDWSSDVCSSYLLVHGFAGDKDNWPMLAAHLRAYHVIAPDLPGFGENERNPQLAYDVEAQTARLKGFVDALGLDRPHIAGNRSEEHTSELQSLMRISYAVFRLQKTKHHHHQQHQPRSLRPRTTEITYALPLIMRTKHDA